MYERSVNGEPDYQIRLESGYLAHGPDGQGRNRLAIHMMEPMTRCVLRPVSRQAALDTLRGMAYHGGDASRYEPCSGSGCANCPVANAVRREWRESFIVREVQGGVVLEGEGSTWFPSWKALMQEVDAPALQRSIDDSGIYWKAA